MTEVEIGDDDWAFIAHSGKDGIELMMPSKEEFDSFEIVFILLSVKRFESALLEVLMNKMEPNDEEMGDVEK